MSLTHASTISSQACVATAAQAAQQIEVLECSTRLVVALMRRQPEYHQLQLPMHAMGELRGECSQWVHASALDTALEE